MEKTKFAAYMAEKRKQKGLTQEQLAERLYVTSTTVSKWERGVTYPDISMITGICRELDISEHEFFSACDDLASRQIKKQAKRYQNIVRGVFWSILLSYVVAVVTCFICNLAIGHTLSWFFIVLVSLLLAFSVTNLPMILHRYQIKYKTFICAAAVTVLVYLLLLVCWLFLGGDWLLSIAYPIATLGLLIVWLGIVVIRCLPINGFFKSGILVLILGVVTAFVNPVIDVILDTSRPFLFYFSQRFIDNPWNLSAACCLAGIAAVLIASGVIWRSSKKK